MQRRQAIGTLFLALLLGPLAGCGEGPQAPVDCTPAQGWSDDALTALSSEANARPPYALLSGLSVNVRPPLTVLADGGILPTIIVQDSGLSFPAFVESVGADGGAAPFRFFAMLDGEPWPVTLLQDGGEVLAPEAQPAGVFSVFDVSMPPVAPGAHDLVMLAVQNDEYLLGGTAYSWVSGGTSLAGALGPAQALTPSALTGNGTGLFLSDGTNARFPAPVDRDAGTMTWRAHFEGFSSDSSTICKGTIQRYRLFAFLDGLPWPFEAGRYHFDVEFPVGGAGDIPLQLSGLPVDDGHVLKLLLQENPGRYQVRPDGTLGPWRTPPVGEVGVAAW